MNRIITWIRSHRQRGKSWEWLSTVGQLSEDGLRRFLEERVELDFWEHLTPEDWRRIVNEQRELSEVEERINDENGATVISASNEDNDIVTPMEGNSAWQCYRRKLLNDGFGVQTVESIENAAIKTLKHLSRDTTNTGPVKGLVVGNVQSGKTANMAALMAMAADYGWNMFIILSGTIESLRKQTQKRLNADLNNDRYRSRFNWYSIDNPIAAEEYGKRVEDYHFDLNSVERLFSVCLKNAARLTNLIEWLKRGADKRRDLRLLIIDDEADQASINVSPNERTTINRLIINLINDRDSRNRNVQQRFRAVNYIGYTATPFANVLNEAPGTDSLYPSNFIATLAVSDEYFGPQQIFGCPETIYDGLNIIRNVPDNHIVDINNIHQRVGVQIPLTLENAVCWFLCGVSCMRLREYHKPISMLVHTSRNTEHHSAIASAIQTWLENTPRDGILEACRAVWDRETRLFDRDDFLEQYPNYNEANGGAGINSLPGFDEIENGIIYLLDRGVTDIRIDNEDGEFVYSEGIHLCIDNSERQNDPNSMRRLLYPDSNNMPQKAPAFIVVGGQTLSRGLTIEGLISTFFLRSSLAADTLMQMGRWFGYRRGYELLPRIWMSRRARNQFEFMAEMDYCLRQEIKQMAETGTDFSEVGPRIRTSPQTSLIRIAAPNRMQGAIQADFDFTGHTMETGVFRNDRNILLENLETARRFIDSLGTPSNGHINEHNCLWRDIELNQIIRFLTDYRYSERLRGFNDLDPLIQWLQTFTNDELIARRWSVILAGNRRGENRWEPVDGISINKVDHTQRGERNDDTINIGVLRSPEDFLTDIPAASQEEERNIKERLNGSHKHKDINDLRSTFDLGQTPQLIIYVINRDSRPREGSKNRYPLNAEADIVGFSINLTGERAGRSAVRTLKIDIPNRNDRLDIE